MFDEPLATAWKLRYGDDPPPGVPADIAGLLRHRSVRDFDTARDVPEATVAGLIAAAQSAATSANLQLWSAISVQDRERRERIATLCADQQQVRDAAWFFAICADLHRVRVVAERAGESPDGLDFIEFFIMALVDAALAAERMCCAAESLGLGVCYIGALRNDPAGVAELLRLPPGVFGVFGLCLGWPAPDSRAAIKPRLDQPAIWFRETYPPQVNVAGYDARMAAFYASQGQSAKVNWSMRSGRRVNGDAKQMTGREVLLQWLRERGFNAR